MTLELLDIALTERQLHPHLENRVTGKVRAALGEMIGAKEIRHEIVVPVWIDTAPNTPEGDVELALLVKAADIIGRVKSRLAQAPVPQPSPLFPPETSRGTTAPAADASGIEGSDAGW